MKLKSLEIALRRLPDCLRPGARMAVISFHSLEDRPVKEAFRSDIRLKVLTNKPIRPEPQEVSQKPTLPQREDARCGQGCDSANMQTRSQAGAWERDVYSTEVLITECQ